MRPSAVLLLVTGLAVAAASPVAQAATTLNSCSPSAFNSAVTAGGTVRFAVDCPSLVVSRTTVVPLGKTLDIEGNGHAVTLSGGGVRQLFKVTGGQLTVRGVTIQSGAAVGAGGANGVPGTPGANGGDGTSGTSGTAGQPGVAGGSG
ncbi:MAG: hypothetical protein ACRDQE_11850, partial [Gaiellales bacterium]